MQTSRTGVPSGPVAQRAIGPALRKLRRKQGWSIAMLAERSGVSQSQISRLERSRNVPSLLTLTRLAAAFGISPDDFTAHQPVDEELAGLLEILAVPRSTWGEFSGLSKEAREALMAILPSPLLMTASMTSPEQQVEDQILKHGVEASIPAIHAAILQYGENPVGHAQALVQFEEQPGQRLVLLDRLPTVPTSCGFDQVQLYRSVFGLDAPDPNLLKWWTTARRTALQATLKRHESRMILPQDQLERYIRTGEWAPGIRLRFEDVRNHILATIEQMRTTPRYRIGLVPTTAPLVIYAKATAMALVMIPAVHPLDIDAQHHGAGTMLCFTNPAVITLLVEYIEQLWERIPEECKDSQTVMNWLEECLTQRLAESDQRSFDA